MLEIHFDKRGEIALENIADILRAYPRFGRRAFDSALSSEGYRLRSELQNAIKPGGPDGSWPAISPYTDLLKRAQRKRKNQSGLIKNRWKKGGYKMHRALKMGIRVASDSTRAPFLRLRAGIRYAVDKDMNMMTVGFVNTSRSMVRLAHFHAEGFKTPITKDVRKMFWALAIPLKKG